MTGLTAHTRTFPGEFTVADVFDWLATMIENHPDRTPKGIAVSNRLHQMGIAGDFNGVPIAMDPALYPDDQVRIVFE